jgi:hypothetical protein
MAVHDRAILIAENGELRAENKSQKRERAQRRSTIARGGTLTMQEGQDRVSRREVVEQRVEEVQISQPPAEESLPRTRAPPRRSLCNSLLHTARSCPNV